MVTKVMTEDDDFTSSSFSIPSLPTLLPSSPSPNPFAHLPDFVHSASAASYTPFSVNLDGITGSLKKYSTSILRNSYEERLLDIFKVNRFNHATQSI